MAKINRETTPAFVARTDSGRHYVAYLPYAKATGKAFKMAALDYETPSALAASVKPEVGKERHIHFFTINAKGTPKFQNIDACFFSDGHCVIGNLHPLKKLGGKVIKKDRLNATVPLQEALEFGFWWCENNAKPKGMEYDFPFLLKRFREETRFRGRYGVLMTGRDGKTHLIDGFMTRKQAQMKIEAMAASLMGFVEYHHAHIKTNSESDCNRACRQFEWFLGHFDYDYGARADVKELVRDITFFGIHRDIKIRIAHIERDARVWIDNLSIVEFGTQKYKEEE